MKSFLLIVFFIFSANAFAKSYVCKGQAVFVKTENGEEVKRGNLTLDGTFEITYDRNDSFAKFTDQGKFTKRMKVSKQGSVINANDRDGGASKYIVTKFTLDLDSGDADIYSEAKRGQTMWIRHMLGTCY